MAPQLGIGNSVSAEPVSTLILGNTYSVDFDGTNQRADFGTPSVFASQALNTFDCTLAAWAKFDTINSYEAIVCLGTFDLEIAPTTSTGVGIWVDNAAYGGSLFTPVMGEWNHYVATKDGNTYTLYVNGAQIGQSDDSDNATIGTTSYIGHNGSEAFFDGDIDEVAVFDSALSAGEIVSIYNGGKPQSLASYNPVGWWRMGDNDGGTGSTITDQGSGINDAVLVNSATISTTIP